MAISELAKCIVVELEFEKRRLETAIKACLRSKGSKADLDDWVVTLDEVNLLGEVLRRITEEYGPPRWGLNLEQLRSFRHRIEEGKELAPYLDGSIRDLEDAE